MEVLDSAPSTMDVARDNLSMGRVRFDAGGNAFPPGVMAREQTAGRGQRGRTWFARPGECLCATYYFTHGLKVGNIEQAGQISFVAGVAVCQALRELCPTTNAARLGLKWPNDILLNGKKLGGILIELAQAKSYKAGQVEAEHALVGGEARVAAVSLVALVGVGLNIAVMDFPPELAPFATSLKRERVLAEHGNEAANEMIRLRLADAIAHSLESWGRRWQTAGLAAILASWRQYDQTPGRAFETTEGRVGTEGTASGVTARGIAEGVADDGALRLRLPDGRVISARSASSLREIFG